MYSIQHDFPDITHSDDKSNAPLQNVRSSALVNSNAKSSPPRPSNTGEAFAELKKIVKSSWSMNSEGESKKLLKVDLQRQDYFKRLQNPKDQNTSLKKRDCFHYIYANGLLSVKNILTTDTMYIFDNI